MRVLAYRNLNCKAGVVQWSIYSEALKCVIAHCDEIALEHAELVVDPSKLRYMRDVLRKRWVVGWAVGELMGARGLRPAGRTERGRAAFEALTTLTAPLAVVKERDRQLRFNPWTMDRFEDVTGTPVSAARVVLLMRDGGCWGLWQIKEGTAC